MVGGIWSKQQEVLGLEVGFGAISQDVSSVCVSMY